MNRISMSQKKKIINQFVKEIVRVSIRPEEDEASMNMMRQTILDWVVRPMRERRPMWPKNFSTDLRKQTDQRADKPGVCPTPS